MGLGLNPADTPELFKDKHGKELPIESLTGTDKTAYLKIDLKVDAKGGQPVEPMTAVFAPDPTRLSDKVDVILWLHGDKHYWDNSGANDYFRGQSIRDYLTKFALCKLREFILQSSKRKFLLVAPTLNDKTGANVSETDKRPGALRWDAADAEAYLQQALNGAKKHLGVTASSLGNIVLAAHSGGGHLQAQMAQYFAGKFDQMNEVWCFDSSYWGSSPLIHWVRKGHSNARLWVHSTKGTTARHAAKILEFTKPLPPPPARRARTPFAKVGAMIDDTFHSVRAATHALMAKTRNIDVLIERDPQTGKPSSTDFYFATYGGIAGGHYEGIKQYLTRLVETSRNLT